MKMTLRSEKKIPKPKVNSQECHIKLNRVISNNIPQSMDINIILEYVKHGVSTLAHFHEKFEDENEFVIQINRFKPTHKFMSEFSFNHDLV